MIILVVLVVLVLIILLLFKKKEVKKVKKNRTIKDTNIAMPNIIGLSFPKTMEKLSNFELRNISKKVFDSYKIFDYQKMDVYALDKKDWHTWQISFLLMLYKRDEELFIANQKSVFADFLLNSDENDIKSLMSGIIRKYDNYVDIYSSKDDLCKEHIWSNRDVSVVFYFLANYKRYNK
jgi:hypothetical protein